MPGIGRFLLGALLLVGSGCFPRHSPEPISVGHVAPLTGALRSAGEHAQHGILLAVEEATEEDRRIHGRRVAVLHADDRGDPEQTLAQAVRLATVNRTAALVGGVDPTGVERLVRAGQTHGLPVVALGSLRTVPSGDGVVSLTVSPSAQGRVLGRFTREKLKSKSAAVVIDGRSSSSLDLAAAFGKEFPERPEELTYQTDAEFPELVKRLLRLRPSAVLIAASARDFLRLARLLQEGGFEGALLYGGPEGELELLRADRDASHGVYLATTYLPDAGLAVNKEFVNKYRNRFGETPDVAAALAHDGVRLLFDAMRRAPMTDLAELRRELSQTEKFESLTGPLTFGKDAHAVRPLFLARFDRGELQQVRQYNPESR